MGRAFMFELPHTKLQFKDINKTARSNARSVVEQFIRLTLCSTLENAEKHMLWITEPEIVLDGDVLLVPRIILNEAMNERSNATRRRITENVISDEVSVETVSADGSLSLQEMSQSRPIAPEYTNIQVEHSVALPSQNHDHCFLCLGHV